MIVSPLSTPTGEVVTGATFVAVVTLVADSHLLTRVAASSSSDFMAGPLILLSLFIQGNYGLLKTCDLLLQRGDLSNSCLKVSYLRHQSAWFRCCLLNSNRPLVTVLFLMNRLDRDQFGARCTQFFLSLCLLS